MKRRWCATVALGVVLALAGGAEAAPGGSGKGDVQGMRRSGRRTYYRSSRRNPDRRSSRRTVVRPVGITLPQLRTELSRLETGLGARVQRIEKSVARPAPPVIVAPPLVPPPVAPGLPVVPTAACATALAAVTGALGFALGLRWARRAAPDGAAAVAPRPQAGDRAGPSWFQLRERLAATEERLSVARARMRQLDRRG